LCVLGEIDPAESIGGTTEALGVVFKVVFITWGEELAGLVDETPSVRDEWAVGGFGLVHRPENHLGRGVGWFGGRDAFCPRRKGSGRIRSRAQTRKFEILTI